MLIGVSQQVEVLGKMKEPKIENLKVSMRKMSKKMDYLKLEWC